MTGKIVHVVAARPNFIKMAPVIEALSDAQHVQQLVVHTGQHYDISMSDSIQADLRLPTPDVHLDVRSGTHGEQTGRTLVRFERLLLPDPPDLVIVAGDVNATPLVPLLRRNSRSPSRMSRRALRSRDWAMPEEMNRVLTDRMSALLFTHSPEAALNLADEGIPPDAIHYVGNTMIDSLIRVVKTALERNHGGPSILSRIPMCS